MGQSKEISGKIGDDQKSLMPVSLEILVPMTNILFLEGRLPTRLCLHPILRFS